MSSTPTVQAENNNVAQEGINSVPRPDYVLQVTVERPENSKSAAKREPEVIKAENKHKDVKAQEDPDKYFFGILDKRDGCLITFCKLLFFILLLPVVGVYFILNGICTKCLGPCCEWSYKNICVRCLEGLGNVLKWLEDKCNIFCDKVAQCLKPCLTPIWKCFSACCNAFGKCCKKIEETLMLWIDKIVGCISGCLSSCCKFLWKYTKSCRQGFANCMEAICVRIQKFCTRCSEVIMKLCEAIYTHVIKHLFSLITFVGKSIYKYILLPIWKGICAIGKSIYKGIVKPIGKMLVVICRSDS